MMKLKPFVAILFFLVCSSALANAHDAAAQSLVAKAPAAPPKPPAPEPTKKWILPPNSKLPPFNMNLIPFSQNPQVHKCLGGRPRSGPCMHDIVVSFLKHRVTLKPDCCKTIQKLDHDCSKAVFGGFKNKFFLPAVKNQCSKSVSYA